MKLKCLGSGSSGNCYLLIAGNGETLIIDPGLQIKEIKKALNWNISCVVGAVCTHHHADHAKSVKDLEQMGISVFKPYESPKPMSIEGTCWTIQGFELTDKTGKFMHTNADGSECPCYGSIALMLAVLNDDYGMASNMKNTGRLDTIMEYCTNEYVKLQLDPGKYTPEWYVEQTREKTGLIL